MFFKQHLSFVFLAGNPTWPSDVNYKDPTNLQTKIQKHHAFEAEVATDSNPIGVLDNTGMEMINQEHFKWELLLHK